MKIASVLPNCFALVLMLLGTCIACGPLPATDNATPRISGQRRPGHSLRRILETKLAAGHRGLGAAWPRMIAEAKLASQHTNTVITRTWNQFHGDRESITIQQSSAGELRMTCLHTALNFYPSYVSEYPAGVVSQEAAEDVWRAVVGATESCRGQFRSNQPQNVFSASIDFKPVLAPCDEKIAGLEAVFKPLVERCYSVSKGDLNDSWIPRAWIDRTQLKLVFNKTDLPAAVARELKQQITDLADGLRICYAQLFGYGEQMHSFEGDVSFRLGPDGHPTRVSALMGAPYIVQKCIQWKIGKWQLIKRPRPQYYAPVRLIFSAN